MNDTFVKKVLADSMLYRKCPDVEANLLPWGLFGRFDKITIADEREPASAGMQLTRQFDIDVAPSSSWKKKT
jgi:hypothetical protein